MRKSILLITALTLATGSAWSASVEVKFTDSDNFTDIGRGSVKRSQALDALKQHLEALGKQLPASQALRVEVTDVDLAGEERFSRHGTDLRVLRGRADWPRINLRYTLSDGARTLQQGQESLADLNYLQMQTGLTTSIDLPYEKRMLERWFSERLVTAAPK
jgi:hypothetical protein